MDSVTGLRHPRREWMDCHVTKTDESVHEVIREHCRSPMTRQSGVGPRYCPYRNKIVRFPERQGHTLIGAGRSHTDPLRQRDFPGLPADAQEQLTRIRVSGLPVSEAWLCGRV